jgi:hypothetical protein
LRIADCGLRISFPEDIRPDNPRSAIRNRALQIGVTRRGGPKQVPPERKVAHSAQGRVPGVGFLADRAAISQKMPKDWQKIAKKLAERPVLG